MFYVVMLTDLGNVGSLARVSHHDSGRNQFLRLKTPCFRMKKERYTKTRYPLSSRAKCMHVALPKLFSSYYS